MTAEEVLEETQRVRSSLNFPLPASRLWLYDAIRHYARNVPYDEPDDGFACTRHDGDHVADLVNLMPAIISALRDNVRMREALAKTTDALIEILPRIHGAKQDEITCRGFIAGLIAEAQATLTESQPVPGNVESEE